MRVVALVADRSEVTAKRLLELLELVPFGPLLAGSDVSGGDAEPGQEPRELARVQWYLILPGRPLDFRKAVQQIAGQRPSQAVRPHGPEISQQPQRQTVVLG